MENVLQVQNLALSLLAQIGITGSVAYGFSIIYSKQTVAPEQDRAMATFTIINDLAIASKASNKRSAKVKKSLVLELANYLKKRGEPDLAFAFQSLYDGDCIDLSAFEEIAEKIRRRIFREGKVLR